jgi:leucyl-tRNA synthetase
MRKPARRLRSARIEKMSKSKKNTIDPMTSSRATAPTTARWFMLSDSARPSGTSNGPIRASEGAHRFIQRVWRVINDIAEEKGPGAKRAAKPAAFGAGRNGTLRQVPSHKRTR